MSSPVLFKKLGNFGPPDQLTRQLAALEGNIDDAFRRLAAANGILSPTPVKTIAYAAKIGELVPFDTAGASGKVALPVATVDNAGLPVGVIRLSASNTLIVAPPSGTVQGGAADTLPATVGLYLYYPHPVKGWWRRA